MSQCASVQFSSLLEFRDVKSSAQPSMVRILDLPRPKTAGQSCFCAVPAAGKGAGRQTAAFGSVAWFLQISASGCRTGVARWLRYGEYPEKFQAVGTPPEQVDGAPREVSRKDGDPESCRPVRRAPGERSRGLWSGISAIWTAHGAAPGDTAWSCRDAGFHGRQRRLRVRGQAKPSATAVPRTPQGSLPRQARHLVRPDAPPRIHVLYEATCGDHAERSMQQFLSHGYEVTGIDLSERMLAIAWQNLRSYLGGSSGPHTTRSRSKDLRG